jgi:hypothetical protein
LKHKILSFFLPFLLSACSIAPIPHGEKPKSGWGKIEGTIKTEWHPKGRDMTLLEDVKYIDPTGREWIALKGEKINGASIPKAFWSVIGGPYEGPYRDASVFHDVGCSNRNQTWEDVHYMFYTAMRSKGVNEKKAKIMYAAVYRFGPRWKVIKTLSAPVSVPTSLAKEATLAEVKKVTDFINKDNPSLEKIEDAQAVTLPGKPAREEKP